MIRSLVKGSRQVYFQQEHTGHKIRAKYFESEIQGHTAILRFTLKPVDANQSQDEKLLHKEFLILASLTDETIIKGFWAHTKLSPTKITEYKMEILSWGKMLSFYVQPKIEVQSDVEFLYLNVKDR